jgi:uncharacterized protein with PQ loop repeat
MEIIGWIGSILLALCAVPLAWQSFVQKHSDGISNAFLVMWLIGELLTFAYVLPKKDLPLLFNYGLNIACLVVVIRYKINPVPLRVR